ncbi:MAG: cupin domain-containing protein [Geminicoccaceae bacterium]
MPMFNPSQFIREKYSGDVCGPGTVLWISETGGLTQFGAFIHILPPGSSSSIKHWHSNEDELVYVLAGSVTLIEAEDEILLGPGDAATFRAGTPVGHCLENRGHAPARFLVVGARAALDQVTYPDHDRICHRDRAQPEDVWTDGNGKPASNPYET